MLLLLYIVIVVVIVIVVIAIVIVAVMALNHHSIVLDMLGAGKEDGRQGHGVDAKLA